MYNLLQIPAPILGGERHDRSIVQTSECGCAYRDTLSVRMHHAVAVLAISGDHCDHHGGGARGSGIAGGARSIDRGRDSRGSAQTDHLRRCRRRRRIALTSAYGNARRTDLRVCRRGSFASSHFLG